MNPTSEYSLYFSAGQILCDSWTVINYCVKYVNISTAEFNAHMHATVAHSDGSRLAYISNTKTIKKLPKTVSIGRVADMFGPFIGDAYTTNTGKSAICTQTPLVISRCSDDPFIFKIHHESIKFIMQEVQIHDDKICWTRLAKKRDALCFRVTVNETGSKVEAKTNESPYFLTRLEGFDRRGQSDKFTIAAAVIDHYSSELTIDGTRITLIDFCDNAHTLKLS